MTDLFTVALGISLAAGLLTILIIIVVTRISAGGERERRTYEAPPRPTPPPAPPEPRAEPKPSAVPKPPEAPRKKAVGKPKRPRKKGKIEHYPDCFGTKYLYEKCKRDCGVVEECLKSIKILEPYS